MRERSEEETGLDDQCPRGASKVVMNALMANPCSLNLVPPAKKHKPRTCENGPSQMSLCDRTGGSKTFAYQYYGRKGVAPGQQAVLRRGSDDG